MQLIDVVMNWLRFRTFFVRCPPDDRGSVLGVCFAIRTNCSFVSRKGGEGHRLFAKGRDIVMMRVQRKKK